MTNIGLGDDARSKVVTTRIDQILEQRRRVIDIIDQATEAVHDGHITTRQARTYIRRAVHNYYLETKWLLRRWYDEHDDDPPTDYLNDFDLGTVELPNDERIHFSGLEDFDNADNPLTCTVVRKSQSETRGTQQSTEEIQVQLPREISISAYDAINGFLSDVGLDLSLEQDSDLAEGRREEIEDILDEKVP